MGDSHSTQNLVEQHPGFFYPLPEKISGARLLARRVWQFTQILTSSAFSDPKKMLEKTSNRYATDREIDYYTALTRWGFHDYESMIAEFALSKINDIDQPRALVLGCGAGREILALNQTRVFGSFTGVDICPKMIELAKKLTDEKSMNAKIIQGTVFNFTANVKKTAKEPCYDLIWVTGSLDAHIQGRMNRISFYKKCAELLSDEGVLVLIPALAKKENFSRKIGSKLLRLRWLGQGRWEEGDTASSFMGIHNDSAEMIYMHFYRDSQDFIDELKAAGLFPFQVPPPKDCVYTEIEGWIVEKPPS